MLIVNAWIVNNLSLVNIFGETGRLFYNINYMLNSKHLSLVNKIGDKTEFTITRVHCTSLLSPVLKLHNWCDTNARVLIWVYDAAGESNLLEDKKGNVNDSLEAE